MDRDAVRDLESTVVQQPQPALAEILAKDPRDSGIDMAEPKQKRRAPSSWLDDRQKSIHMSPLPMESSSTWREQHGQIEVETSESGLTQPVDIDQVMQDATSPLKPEYQPATTRPNKRSSHDVALTDLDLTSPSRAVKRSSFSHSRHPSLNLFPPLHPSLTQLSPTGPARINWHYLYKHRRRLEDNWRQGVYANYQLPQVGYEHEGHRECVYTIQFFGKWLVSGSRDHTMRVWDLETKRLRGKPLIGHTQSVLCLQFDPRPEEDVIISGSSDTTIRIWRFSTGQHLQTLKAHKESVLNLRFDERYLVTCSKDKLIKVWNRQEMDASSPNYPKIDHKSSAQFPSYIVDTTHYSSLVLEQKIANRTIKTLSPYSLVMQLEGHGAAINAIQIDCDKIVSASGDRNIKIWDIRSGRLLHTLVGHHKGIACVQFDSKRIVSGSSDNSIRIYDQVTGAEVACLKGHANLVRTVQAWFGDAPGSEEVLRMQAEHADREWRAAVQRGEIIPEEVRTHRRSRRLQASAKDPRSISAIGAALPPGGGGSQWGRIVSGSYDEHIIIWKKDADGRWIPSHRLNHGEASRIATAQGAAAAAARAKQAFTHSLASGATTSQDASAPSGPSSAPANPNAGSTGGADGANAIAPANPNLQLQGQNPGVQQAAIQLAQHAQMMNHQQLLAQVTVVPQPQAVVHVQPVANQLPTPHRVFKLQFDARKIICCSQDPRIVVWDFANGDKEIEETSRFFTAP